MCYVYFLAFIYQPAGLTPTCEYVKTITDKYLNQAHVEFHRNPQQYGKSTAAVVERLDERRSPGPVCRLGNGSTGPV